MKLRTGLRLFVFLMLAVPAVVCQAQTEDDYNFSYVKRFYYKVDRYNIDETIPGNAAAIDSILTKVRDIRQRQATNIRVHVIGSASLEASDEYNAKLAANRSHGMVDYLRKFKVMNDTDIHADDGIYDWTVLTERVKNSDCPNREALLQILEIPSGDISIGERKERIKNLGNGATFQYISQHFFSQMRYASIRITAVVPEAEPVTRTVTQTDTVVVETVTQNTVLVNPAKSHVGIIGIRTNGLYDAATIPNLGVDVYVSQNVSVGLNWMYSWWKTDRKHRYWRTYGGDLHADYWFDPTLLWSGHHLGGYLQMGTYDFEWKGVGYQGPKWTWGGGVDYGYSMWLSPQFSLDFNVGIGYVQGKQYEYTPGVYDDYYLDRTKTLHWFGPTKLEISLIWKLGKDY